MHDKTAVRAVDALDRRAELHLDSVLCVLVHLTENLHVSVGSQMADLGIQQMQIVLQRDCLQVAVFGGVQPGFRTAHLAQDTVDIFHQPDRFVATDVLVQHASEFVGYVVFAVGQRAGTAEPAHDMARIALDARLRETFFNRTRALLQPLATIQH